MAHLAFEWVKRKQTSFGTTSGEVQVVGEPVDVGDWEEMVVQLTTLAVDGSPGGNEILAAVQTSISTDEHVGWDTCVGGTAVSYTEDGYLIIKVTPDSSHGLRKWARLILIHQATSAHKITIHAWCLLKKRTP